MEIHTNYVQIKVKNGGIVRRTFYLDKNKDNELHQKARKMILKKSSVYPSILISEYFV